MHYLMTDFARAGQLQPFAQVAGGRRAGRRRREEPLRRGGSARAVVPLGGGFVYDQHPPKPPARRRCRSRTSSRDTRRGYCQHFAGAMALMLRYLGIPLASRGRVRQRQLHEHGEWVVSDRNAHMWVEVWFHGWGWMPFDPTPSRGGARRAVLGLVAELRRLRGDRRAAGKEGFEVRQRAGEHARLRPQARTSPDVPQLGTLRPGWRRRRIAARLGHPAAARPRRSRRRSCCSLFAKLAGVAARAS